MDARAFSATLDRDPLTLITLKPFVVKKKDREIPQSKASGGIVPFTGVKIANCAG